MYASRLQPDAPSLHPYTHVQVAEQCSFKPQLAASLKSYNSSGGLHSPRKGGANSMLKPPGYQQVLPHYYCSLPHYYYHLTITSLLPLPHHYHLTLPHYYFLTLPHYCYLTTATSLLLPHHYSTMTTSPPTRRWAACAGRTRRKRPEMPRSSPSPRRARRLLTPTLNPNP